MFKHLMTRDKTKQNIEKFISQTCMRDLENKGAGGTGSGSKTKRE
jgi:hypothetical protein